MKYSTGLFLMLLFLHNTLDLSAQGGFADVGKKKYKQVYGVIVGISDYAEIKDLNYADKDAELFYKVLQTRFPDSKSNIHLLTNEAANQGNVKKHVYQACKAATSEDLVILYFSGHGDVMSVYGTDYGYFLAHDASKSREYESGGAIEFEFINRHVNGAAATKKCDVWLITDACRAGKVINETGARATLTTLNQSFLQTTKFVSCQANELSYEDSSLTQGVFTYYLMKGLSGEAEGDSDQSSLTIDELNQFLRTSVRKHTSGKQTPKASSSDDFQPFFTPTPSIAALLNKGKGSDLMASRDVGDELTISDFEKAIQAGELRENAGSAHDLYLEAVRNKRPETELENMREELATELATRGQRTINKFLSGRPLLANENFEKAEKDFALAKELLGSDHYLTDEISEKLLFVQAMVIVEKNEFEKFKVAETNLLKLIEQNKVAAYTHLGLSQLYFKQNKADLARKQCEIAHEKVKTWTKPQNLQVKIYLENGQLAEAENLLKTDIKDENTLLLESEVKSSNLELQLAEEALKNLKVNQGSLSNTELALLEGKIEQQRGRIRLAESIYKKALVEDSKNMDLHLRLADLYLADLDTINAIRWYKKSLAIDPKNQTANFRLNALEQKTINPTITSYYNTKEVLGIVDILLDKKDFKQTNLILKEAQKVNTFDPEIDYALAKSAYLQKDLDAAEKHLKAALVKSPYHLESIKSLANIYLLRKDFDNAKKVLETYAPNFKYSSQWRVFTYDVYSKMDKTKNQIFILEEAIKLDSTDVEAYKALYRYEMSQGLYRQAEAEYKQMLRLGTRLKDSSAFVGELTQSIESRILRGQKDNRTVDGLKVLLKYDSYYLARMMTNAERDYMRFNYRDADIELEKFAKYLFCLQNQDRIDYLRLKAKLLLEVKMYREALDLFRQLNEQSYETSYVGVAMAQFELGMPESVWLPNLMRDNNLKGFNQAAVERFQKMSRNKSINNRGY